MAKSDAQKRAEKNYRKKIRKFEIRLSPVDQDMIDYLEGKENIQGYLKELIRHDMDR
jgi:hypothetical protein